MSSNGSSNKKNKKGGKATSLSLSSSLPQKPSRQQAQQQSVVRVPFYSSSNSSSSKNAPALVVDMKKCLQVCVLMAVVLILLVIVIVEVHHDLTASAATMATSTSSSSSSDTNRNFVAVGSIPQGPTSLYPACAPKPPPPPAPSTRPSSSSSSSSTSGQQPQQLPQQQSQNAPLAASKLSTTTITATTAAPLQQQLLQSPGPMITPAADLQLEFQIKGRTRTTPTTTEQPQPSVLSFTKTQKDVLESTRAARQQMQQQQQEAQQQQQRKAQQQQQEATDKQCIGAANDNDNDDETTCPASFSIIAPDAPHATPFLHKMMFQGQMHWVYMEPDVNDIYKINNHNNKQQQAAAAAQRRNAKSTSNTASSPSLYQGNLMLCKFLNLSRGKVHLYHWPTTTTANDGSTSSTTRPPPQYVKTIEPMMATGVGAWPGQEFLWYSDDKSVLYHRSIVRNITKEVRPTDSANDNANAAALMQTSLLYVYDDFRKQDAVTNNPQLEAVFAEKYNLWKRTLAYHKAYKMKTGRSYLSHVHFQYLQPPVLPQQSTNNASQSQGSSNDDSAVVPPKPVFSDTPKPRKPPKHFMWLPRYMNETAWVTSKETHYHYNRNYRHQSMSFQENKNNDEKQPQGTSNNENIEYNDDDETLTRPTDQVLNMTLRALSVAPVVWQIDKFLSPAEAQHLLDIATTGWRAKRMRQSLTGHETLFDPITGKERSSSTLSSASNHNNKKASAPSSSPSTASTRSSRNTWIHRNEAAIVDVLYRRAADLLKVDERLLWERDDWNTTVAVPLSSPTMTVQAAAQRGSAQYVAAEPLQLVHYLPGQEYMAHYDFGYPPISHPLQPSRFATLLIYLNGGSPRKANGSSSNVDKKKNKNNKRHNSEQDDDDNDEEEDEMDMNDVTTIPLVGGETSFPRWIHRGDPKRDLRVTPEIGKAVLFYNMLPDGNMDYRSVHAALPVKEGEKWLCNLWLWDPVIDMTALK